MRGARLVSAFLAATCFLGSFDVAEAKPQPAVKALDRNGDGKVGKKERAAVRPPRAVQRQNRALRRNNAVINSIK